MSFRYFEPHSAFIGYGNEPVMQNLLNCNGENPDNYFIDLSIIEKSENLYIGVDAAAMVISTESLGTVLIAAGTPVFSRAFVRTHEGNAGANIRNFMENLLLWTQYAPSGSLIMNRPNVSGAMGSKLSHLRELHAAGFQVPSTTLSTDANTLRKHGKTIINKGVSSVRTIASRDLFNRFASGNQNLVCPALVQDFVEGYDVRVHFVGIEYFALKIQSKYDDYRYAKRNGYSVSFEEMALPDSVADICWRYMALCGLEFGGFDFKVDRDGTYWALECNAMPGFSFFDKFHNGGIGRAICKYIKTGYSQVNWRGRGQQSIIDESRLPTLDVGL